MLIRKLTYRTIALLLSAGSMLTGCVTDDVDSGNPTTEPDPDVYALSFDITLNAYDGTTRVVPDNHDSEEPEEWENVIDFTNQHTDQRGNGYKFHILMFDEDNNFIYNPSNDPDLFYVTNIGVENGNQLRWRVVFAAPEKVRDYIKNNPFKVAVFANWPDSKVHNPNTGKDDPMMRVEFETSLTGFGEPRISISELAHSVYDQTYGGSNWKVYDFLTDSEGRMGPYTNWVFNYHSSQDDAAAFIRGLKADANGLTREDYDRMIKLDGGKYNEDPRIFIRDFEYEFLDDTRRFQYNNLWRVWNFGGLSNLNAEDCYDGSEYFRQKWADINEKMMINAFKSAGVTINSTAEIVNQTLTRGVIEFGDSDDTAQALEDLTYFPSGLLPQSHKDYWLNEKAKGTLEYINTSGRAQFGRDERGTYLLLPRGGSASVAESNTNGRNALHLMAMCTTSLRIKADNPEDLVITADANKFEYTSWGVGDSYDSTDGSWYLEIPYKVGDVFIYANGKDVKVYEVETFDKKYLYDTDRRASLPSTHQLIPMYGIQAYEPIGDYWIPGNVFDLSNYNGYEKDGYDYKKISLLRSVAKVELLVSKEFENRYKDDDDGYNPYLFLRSMNRDARCMPLDVATPTEQIWANVDDEIRNIRSYGPFYDPNDKDVTSFQRRLAWFFMTWSDLWGWKTGFQDIDNRGSAYYGLPSPHVFNGKINRSDFVRFIKVKARNDADAAEFDRYVAYMPEKAIDDANDAGTRSSTPKVPHIELRLKGEPDFNLDDNRHDRIYFVDYSQTPPRASSTDKNGSPDFDAYEKDMYNLRNHWPIMRNHVYRFRVRPTGTRSSDGSNIQVSMEVEAPVLHEAAIPDSE